MDVAREVCPGFKLEEHQKSLVNDIFRWCMRLPGRLNLARGLWIWGDIGSGKSTLMRIIDRFLLYQSSIGADPDFLPCRWMNIIPANEICDTYAEEGVPGLKKFLNVTRLCIDDVAIETRITSHYGTPMNVIGNLIAHRYNLMHRSNQVFTFATTNINPQQIAEIYDERIYDRCGEMFNFIHFEGFTHRPEINNFTS